jgi:hypothetical protein
MNYTALSLSQSPPLSVPLRFFLTAPLFVITAALLMLFAGDNLFASRWSPAMLALTHLVTLGFLGSCMLGALQQLLPVLLGTPLPAPRRTSTLLHGLWTLGSGLLVLGMGYGWHPGLQGGALLLGLALALLVPLAGLALWRTSSRHATVPAMTLALVALGAAFLMALSLLVHFNWQLPLAHPWSRYHIGWAALGWIGLLIIGVAYQVVPMFQITPAYPRWMRRALVPLLGLLLLLWPLLPWSLADILIRLLLATGMALFAVQTLWLQQQRRRRLADVTLDFWRLAMGSLLLAILLWLIQAFYPQGRLELAVGVVFLFGFATSAVNGMLYKIVPFLIWLHLNNRLQQAGQWQGKVPNMKQVIPERQARWQFRLHLAALALLLAAVLLPLSPQVVGLVWLVNGGWLAGNLWQALRLYRRVVAGMA